MSNKIFIAKVWSFFEHALYKPLVGHGSHWVNAIGSVPTEHQILQNQ